VSIPAWLEQPPWMPVDAPIKGDEDNRSAHLLVDIAAQFDVLRAPRYAAKDGRTWCKTYLWDVLSALGCGEVAAHWVDSSGVPVKPKAPGSRETRANEVVMRLGRNLYSWRAAEKLDAFQAAESGRPVVAGWFNKGAGSGHVALVLPGGTIAQAGATNLFGAPVSRGFGDLAVSFFVHP
jgi:hypothetical protein